MVGEEAGAIVAVLKVQGNDLGRDYMRRMAGGRGGADLLSRASKEAG